MLNFIYTEYFKHATHSPFFSSTGRLFHNATFFGSCIIHILLQVVLKFKCKLRCQKLIALFEGRLKPEQEYGFESPKRPSECQPNVPPCTVNVHKKKVFLSIPLGLTEEVFFPVNK
jgi:hypothetical protein